MRFRPVPAIAIACVLAAASGCARHAPEPAANTQLRSQALIDSGNVAFHAKDYEGAAKRYASAAAVKPDDPAAYFGLGMALSRLGRDDDAREAYARARALLAAHPDTSAGR